MTSLDSILKSRDITLPINVCLVKAMVLPVVMYEYQSWTVMKAERRKIDILNCGVGEDSWESLGSKEIQPVYPKWNKSWIFIGRTDAEAKTPTLLPSHGKSWLIWTDTDAGKDLRQKEKGTTEAEIVGWHHWLNVHEFEQALGVDDGQGNLACCSPWGHRVTTEWLNWTELIWPHIFVLI